MSREGTTFGRVVTAVVEEVFAAVGRVSAETVRLSQDRRGQPLAGTDVSTLAPSIQQQLRENAGLVVGLGLIVAPGLLQDERLRLEWWQQRPDGELSMLDVDLNRTSLGFYDYEAAEWFEVPRRSSARHVVGPYVDVHGTGSYMLTFAIPVVVDDTFVGVAGADVAAARFERRVLERLTRPASAVILNADDRVVFSTSPRWLTGSRADPADVASELDVVSLDALPWRVGTSRHRNH